MRPTPETDAIFSRERSHADYEAFAQKLERERDGAVELLKEALGPLDMYYAYGWPDRDLVRGKIRDYIKALAGEEGKR